MQDADSSDKRDEPIEDLEVTTEASADVVGGDFTITKHVDASSSTLFQQSAGGTPPPTNTN